MLEPGQLFGGRYKISSLLARGGMGEVYLAEQGLEGFARPVVIKTLLPSLSARRDLVRLFLEEAQLAAQLTHPNIVHVYDVGREEDLYFFVMEYLHGSTLSELMRRRRKQKLGCSPAFLAAVGVHVCAALHYAFTKSGPDGQPLRVVHRDISPPNILLTLDGDAKVLDFGIAKASNSTSSTRIGELKGKPSYMSPEQARGMPVDARSDLFSLGIVLWEAATGTKLFAGANAAETAARVCDAPITPLTALLPGFPADLAAVVGRALEREPERRFQSAAEAGKAFEVVLGRLSAEGPQGAVRAELDAASGGTATSPARGSGWVPEWAGDEGARGTSGFQTGIPAIPGNAFERPAPGSQLPSVSLACEPFALAVPEAGSHVGPAAAAPVPAAPFLAPVAPAPVAPARSRSAFFAFAGALLVASAVALWIHFDDRRAQPQADPKPAARADLPQAEPEQPASGVSPWIEELKTVRADVASTPDGAEIWVDGKPIGKKTPAIFDLDTGKEHVVELRHPDCLPFSKSMFVAPNEPVQLAAQLVPGAKVTVETEPRGAEVEIDGVKAFDTPGTSAALAVGKHLLFVRLPFHAVERREIDVVDAQPRTLSLRLVKGAEVEVKSLPAGAEILVDGKGTGVKTPATISVPFGKNHRVGVRLEGFVPASRALPRLVEGSPRSVELKLVSVKQVELEAREARLKAELDERTNRLAELNKKLSGMVVKRSAAKELAMQREADAAERQVEDLEGELNEVREQLLPFREQ